MPARASAIEDDLVGLRTESAADADLLCSGPKMVVMALAAVPVTVVGLSAPSALELMSGLITGLWFALLPVALYRRWATVALPFVAGGLLLFAIVALPFNSPAFIVDCWGAAIMITVGLPKR